VKHSLSAGPFAVIIESKVHVYALDPEDLSVVADARKQLNDYMKCHCKELEVAFEKWLKLYGRYGAGKKADPIL
jgi:hypothetical protein